MVHFLVWYKATDKVRVPVPSLLVLMPVRPACTSLGWKEEADKCVAWSEEEEEVVWAAGQPCMCAGTRRQGSARHLLVHFGGEKKCDVSHVVLLCRVQ
jgi:hypothetical protein